MQGFVFRQYRSSASPSPWWKRANEICKAKAGGYQASGTTELLAALAALCRAKNVSTAEGDRWQQMLAAGSFPIVDINGRYQADGEYRSASGETLSNVVDSTFPEWCDVTIHADQVPYPVLIRYRDRWFWVDSEHTQDWAVAGEDMVRIARPVADSFHIDGMDRAYTDPRKAVEAWSEKTQEGSCMKEGEGQFLPHSTLELPNLWRTLIGNISDRLACEISRALYREFEHFCIIRAIGESKRGRATICVHTDSPERFSELRHFAHGYAVAKGEVWDDGG